MRILFLFCALFCAADCFAAVGCDLNDPDRDINRLFPGSSGYKTVYLSVKTPEMLARIEKRLGDKFHGLYENIGVPYTLYEIYRDKEKIGYVHGVNQKGDYGGIQVFLALDPAGTVKAFYIQKLTSRTAKELRSKEFAAQFEGLSLKNFRDYDPLSGKAAPVKNPASQPGGDFLHVLRAVKKNLILMDEFVFSK
ncbi:MAG: hypothetical protein WC421_08020 [Elusimicrobiales bacterium]